MWTTHFHQKILSQGPKDSPRDLSHEFRLIEIRGTSPRDLYHELSRSLRVNCYWDNSVRPNGNNPISNQCLRSLKPFRIEYSWQKWKIEHGVLAIQECQSNFIPNPRGKKKKRKSFRNFIWLANFIDRQYAFYWCERVLQCFAVIKVNSVSLFRTAPFSPLQLPKFC